MTSAITWVLCFRICRVPACSKNKMAAQASTRDTLQVSMMISVSLRLMVVAKSQLLIFGSFLHPLGETQKFRTDDEIDAFCRFGVDLEPEIGILEEDIDHTAGIEELVRFSEGQRGRFLSRLEELRQAAILRTGNE